MNYTIKHQNGIIHIHVNKEKLDSLIAHELKAIFNKINETSPQRAILHLSGVKYIDSSGLTALLLGSRKCEKLVLLQPKDMVMKMLEISQLATILPLASSIEEAEQAVETAKVEDEN